MFNKKLKNPDYKLHELHFISTCISFNQEPIALFEIYQKADRKTFVSDSISFPVDSDEIPPSILNSLKILKLTELITNSWMNKLFFENFL